MRAALVNSNGIVENVIVANTEYEHPQFSVRNADGVSVQPGDYYDDAAGEFITPRLTLDTPDTLVNDGQTTADVVIGSTYRDDKDVDFTVSDFTETLTIPSQGSITQTVTTTAAEGSVIRVAAAADGETVQSSIEVVQS